MQFIYIKGIHEIYACIQILFINKKIVFLLLENTTRTFFYTYLFMVCLQLFSFLKCLDELMAIKPVLEDAEGSSIHIPDGFNPSEIKLIGRIKGKPPFKGTIRHKGWKASKLVLPKQLKRTNNEVLMPAEVEVNS